MAKNDTETRPTPTRLMTIAEFSRLNPAFTEGSLRQLFFYRDANGFAPAFYKLGRRVLVDPDRFFALVAAQNSAAGPQRAA